MIIWNRTKRESGPVLKHQEAAGVPYLTFPLLEQTGVVKHLFTTRGGGVSSGIYSSMNLSFQRGDEEAAVRENYRRIGEVLQIQPSCMIASCQTHTTNIRKVGRADSGMGVTRPMQWQDVDGLMTDERGLALVTLYADCVPLYVVDPVHPAIGLAHSGWRGTVAGMGACMVEALGNAYGSQPADLYAAIGPSICQSCYEVSAEVADGFTDLLEGTQDYLREYETAGYTNLSTTQGNGSLQVVAEGKAEGKYQVDLWLANALILRRAGIPFDHIEVTDLCTCENAENLFSHRASQGKRGNLAAFLALK